LKTFLDSGVLLAGWRRTPITDAAMSVIADDTREFYTAQLVKLETLPKAQYEKNRCEQDFYETHFAQAMHCEPLSEALGNQAADLAARYGLAGPDALQIAAAIRQGVSEFITSEKPGRPVFRVKEIRVISLYSLA
jgi:predicted nucleic acid-binding protein